KPRISRDWLCKAPVESRNTSSTNPNRWSRGSITFWASASPMILEMQTPDLQRVKGPEKLSSFCAFKLKHSGCLSTSVAWAQPGLLLSATALPNSNPKGCLVSMSALTEKAKLARLAWSPFRSTYSTGKPEGASVESWQSPEAHSSFQLPMDFLIPALAADTAPEKTSVSSDR